jgi:hypothetical protein
VKKFTKSGSLLYGLNSAEITAARRPQTPEIQALGSGAFR